MNSRSSRAGENIEQVPRQREMSKMVHPKLHLFQAQTTVGTGDDDDFARQVRDVVL